MAHANWSDKRTNPPPATWTGDARIPSSSTPGGHTSPVASTPVEGATGGPTATQIPLILRAMIDQSDDHHHRTIYRNVQNLWSRRPDVFQSVAATPNDALEYAALDQAASQLAEAADPDVKAYHGLDLLTQCAEALEQLLQQMTAAVHLSSRPASRRDVKHTPVQDSTYEEIYRSEPIQRRMAKIRDRFGVASRFLLEHYRTRGPAEVGIQVNSFTSQLKACLEGDYRVARNILEIAGPLNRSVKSFSQQLCTPFVPGLPAHLKANRRAAVQERPLEERRAADAQWLALFIEECHRVDVAFCGSEASLVARHASLVLRAAKVFADLDDIAQRCNRPDLAAQLGNTQRELMRKQAGLQELAKAASSQNASEQTLGALCLASVRQFFDCAADVKVAFDDPLQTLLLAPVPQPDDTPEPPAAIVDALAATTITARPDTPSASDSTDEDDTAPEPLPPAADAAVSAVPKPRPASASAAGRKQPAPGAPDRQPAAAGAASSAAPRSSLPATTQLLQACTRAGRPVDQLNSVACVAATTAATQEDIDAFTAALVYHVERFVQLGIDVPLSTIATLAKTVRKSSAPEAQPVAAALSALVVNKRGASMLHAVHRAAASGELTQLVANLVHAGGDAAAAAVQKLDRWLQDVIEYRHEPETDLPDLADALNTGTLIRGLYQLLPCTDSAPVRDFVLSWLELHGQPLPAQTLSSHKACRQWCLQLTRQLVVTVSKSGKSINANCHDLGLAASRRLLRSLMDEQKGLPPDQQQIVHVTVGSLSHRDAGHLRAAVKQIAEDYGWAVRLRNGNTFVVSRPDRVNRSDAKVD